MDITMEELERDVHRSLENDEAQGQPNDPGAASSSATGDHNGGTCEEPPQLPIEETTEVPLLGHVDMDENDDGVTIITNYLTMEQIHVPLVRNTLACIC